MAKRIIFRLVGIVVILALAYVASSWYIGQRAELLVHNRVAAYNQQIEQQIKAYLPAADLRVTLVVDDYQRHVFSSDVRYTLAIAEGGAVRKLEFAGHLVHGPFPYTEVGRGHVEPLMAASHLRLLPSTDSKDWFAARTDKSRAPVWGRTTLTFNGSARSVWHFQPLAAAQGEATFSGGRATLTLDDNFRDATLNAAFGGFQIGAADTGVQVRDVNVDGLITALGNGKRSFDITTTIGSIASQMETDSGNISKDTRLAINGTLADGLLDSAMKYTVANTRTAGLDTGSMTVAAHVTNVDVAAVRALRRYSRAGGKDETVLKSAVSALLAAQPAVALDRFRWHSPQGTTSANFAVHFERPDTAGGNLLSPRLLKSVHSGKLAVSLDLPMISALVKQVFVGAGLAADRAEVVARTRIQRVAENLKQTGLFVGKGDVVSTDITYADGKFVVNGEQKTLGEIMLGLMRMRRLSM